MLVDSNVTVGPTRRLSGTGGGTTAVGGLPVRHRAGTTCRSTVPAVVESHARSACGVAVAVGTRHRVTAGLAEVYE